MKQFFLVLITSLIVRLCCPFPSLALAIALLPLCAAYGYFLYLESKKELPVNDVFKAELSQLKDAVNALKVGRSLMR